MVTISDGEAAYMYVTEVLEVSPQQSIPVWLPCGRAAANSDDAMVSTLHLPTKSERYTMPSKTRVGEVSMVLVSMVCSNGVTLCILLVSAITLCGCEDLVVHDASSLLVPRFQRSEVLGLVAGFGTTFAAVPDLIAMLRRRSSEGMNPRMAGIMGIFQIVWVYYGLLIASRPVVAWNAIAVVINFLSVGAYLHFVAPKGRKQ
jgi:MtN3 and saliva related transmembrane protein